MYLKDFRKEVRKCYCCEEQLHFSQFKIIRCSKTDKKYFSRFICALCDKEVSKLPRKERNILLNRFKKKKRTEEKKFIKVNRFVVINNFFNDEI